MLRFIKFIVPLIIIIAGASAGFRYLSENKPVPEASNEERPVLSVFAEQVERRTLELSVTTQGEVRPRSEVSVTPQISGRIVFISDRFVDGGYIAKGQTIARLDKTDFELAMVRAQSGIAAAEQALVREQAEAELAVKDLEELGIAASSPLARREPQMAEAQAALDSARAELREAELALERTTITAPFNVRVRAREADIGEFVTPGQNLGSIFATDKVEVALPLTDDQLGQLGLPLAFSHSRANPGPEVTFNATVGGEMRSWTGRITRTAAAVNSESRLINVFGEVIDPYGRGADNGAPMAPGLFVTATMAGKTIDDILWAPRAAVRGDGELYIGVTPEDKGTYETLRDGTLEAVEGLLGGRRPSFRSLKSTKLLSIREIDVVYSDETGAYFENGAEVGELAIVSPVQAAADGMRLSVQERASDGTLIGSQSSIDNNLDVATSGGSQGNAQ